MALLPSQRVSEPEPTQVKGNSWAALHGQKPLERADCKPRTGARQLNPELKGLLEIFDGRAEELTAHKRKTVKTDLSRRQCLPLDGVQRRALLFL